MKILMIAPTPFFSDRGTHIRILEEALALERRDHEIHILTYHIGNQIHESFKSNIHIHRIFPFLFWYRKREAGPSWQKLLLDYQLIWKMIGVVEKVKPDVIHAHLHEGAMLSWLVQKLLFWKRIPLVIDLHGSMTQEMVSHRYLRLPFLHALFQWLERRINSMGQAAIASSTENAERISSDRGSAVPVILDGVNTRTPSVSTIPIELPTNKIIVTYTGAFFANKGIDVLLNTIRVLQERDPRIHVVLAGGPAAKVTSPLRALGLQNSVTVVSPLLYVDVPAILARTDIAIDLKDASTSQASGKLLQYMAAGLPVVCLDRPTNQEALGDGGIYCSTTSPEAIADAIISLAHDPAQRKRMGIQNKTRAQHYNWDSSAAHIEQIYTRLLKYE